MALLIEDIPGLAVDASEGKNRPVLVALGRVVEDHIEHHLDPGEVEDGRGIIGKADEAVIGRARLGHALDRLAAWWPDHKAGVEAAVIHVGLGARVAAIAVVRHKNHPGRIEEAVLFELLEEFLHTVVCEVHIIPCAADGLAGFRRIGKPWRHGDF